MKLYQAVVTVRVVFGSDHPPAKHEALQYAAKELSSNGIADRYKLTEVKHPKDVSKKWREACPWGVGGLDSVQEILLKKD